MLSKSFCLAAAALVFSSYSHAVTVRYGANGMYPCTSPQVTGIESNDSGANVKILCEESGNGPITVSLKTLDGALALEALIKEKNNPARLVFESTY